MLILAITLFILLMPTFACVYNGGWLLLVALASLIPWFVAIIWTVEAYIQWKYQNSENFNDDYV